ncbi:Protein NRT1/ PTR FAMILY 1.2 [Vigna angularis]|uniref:Protein NRT1/ PTR FAMILY 1.2 n=1 Tax=Phaseolus angularis TaxID=3914 RepID=A0A8T0KGP7_PHAAN|nr:Protein NRT1/ PTR FAMILY 1.2 [Vigna angularis]
MPFDASKSPRTLSEDHASMNLVSFWVSDVDLDHRLKKSIPISGFIVIGITRDDNFFVESIRRRKAIREGMSSIAASLFSLGSVVGNLVASLILNIVDDITSKGGKQSWVSDNINKGHYDNNFHSFLTVILLLDMCLHLFQDVVSGDPRSENWVYISSSLAMSKYELLCIDEENDDERLPERRRKAAGSKSKVGAEVVVSGMEAEA